MQINKFWWIEKFEVICTMPSGRRYKQGEEKDSDNDNDKEKWFENEK
jgi:hypothetical protein